MLGHDDDTPKGKGTQPTQFDEELYKLYQEGKEEEYITQLFDHFHHRLYGFSLNMVYAQHKNDVEDIVQEGFLRFIRTPHPTCINHFFYLCQVMRRVYIDKLNKEKKLLTTSLDELRDRGGDQGVERNAIDVPDEIHGEDWVDLKTFLNEVSDKIELLKGNYRIVMRLIRDEDLQEKEIAERLIRPPNTVKSWIRRAKEQLNEMLSEPPSTDKPDEPKKDVRKKKRQNKKKNKRKEDKQ